MPLGTKEPTYKWVDMNSRKPGTSFELNCGSIKISLVNGHIRNPEYWVFHCRELQMDTVSTKLPSDVEFKLAQSIALNMVKSRLRELANALSKV